MKTLVKASPLLLLILLFWNPSDAQERSGREFTRSAIMNGNQVMTVFGNWGIIGQPATAMLMSLIRNGTPLNGPSGSLPLATPRASS